MIVIFFAISCYNIFRLAIVLYAILFEDFDCVEFLSILLHSKCCVNTDDDEDAYIGYVPCIIYGFIMFNNSRRPSPFEYGACLHAIY